MTRRRVLDDAKNIDPSRSQPRSEPRSQIGLASLVKLRFGAAAAQIVVVLVATVGLDVQLPLGLVLSLVATTLGTNFLLRKLLLAGSPDAPGLTAWVLAFDTLILTLLLLASGGPSNPFSVLYLVHVALAAVLLGARLAWGLTALCVFGYGVLFFAPGPEHAHMKHAVGGQYSTHLQGMWVAFTVAAGLIAYFVSRLSEALRQNELEIARLRELAAKNQRLAALTTLAAGAAHELSTPLSTVAVVAKEIHRKAAEVAEPAGVELAEDAALIRTEVERCRAILEQMSAQSGESLGEAPELVPVARILNDLRAGLRRGEEARLSIATEGGPKLVAPPRALVRVLANLVSNAFDASPSEGRVELGVRITSEGSEFEVKDRGTGMSPELLERAVEPFFTTKGPGKGLGLGLFLVQTFADRLGGTLEIDSKPGVGSVVRLRLPARPQRPAPGLASARVSSPSMPESDGLARGLASS